MKKIKKSVQLSDFENNLLENSKNNGRFLATEITWYLYHKGMYLSGLFSLIILFTLISEKHDLFESLSLSTFLISLILVTVVCFIATREGPTNHNELDLWKWKKGRTLMSLKFVCFIFFFITLGIQIGTKEVKYPYLTYGILFFQLSSLLFYSIVKYILLHPQHITNGILTGIGSIGYLGIFIFPPIYFLEVQKFSIFFFLGSLIAFIGILKVIDQIVRKDFINPVQSTVLIYIEPDRLFEAFKDNINLLRNRIKAKKILIKLESKGEFGIKKALAEILVKEKTSQKKFIYTLLGSFVLFIFTSIGEGFWQDLLYEPYLKPFLCKFNTSFCK